MKTRKAAEEATPAANAKRAAKSSSKKRKTPEVDAALPAPKEPTGWEELEAADAAAATAAPAPAPKPKVSKHAKRRLDEAREAAVAAAEARRVAAAAPPASAAEFEAAALAAPSASLVWVHYMAHLISGGDLEGARRVAARALAAINYREEGEKFNVWVAWLNAEALYGTEESALALLGRALTHADARRMYSAAIDVFERCGKGELAEQCLRATCRKFGGDPATWLRLVRFHLAAGDADAARRALERALQALDAREHVAAISGAALLEFKVGDAERGRSLFEGVLRSYPRRLDLWSVYLDQEVARGEPARARALFERATHLALPPKKMKFLFKRYLEYERKHGDAAGVERVKRAAMEFVERAMGGGA